MGDFTIWLALLFGIIIGAVLVYLWMRSAWISKAIYQRLADKNRQTEQDLAVLTEKLSQEKLQVTLLQNNQAAQQQTQESLISDSRILHQNLSKAQANAQALQERLSETTAEISFKNQQIDRLQEAIIELRSDKATLTAQNRSLLDNQSRQEEQMQELNQKAHLEFEKMATEILKDRTQSFTEANKNNLDQLLRPLGENIEGFKKIIRETHIQQTRDQTQLETKISELIQQTNQVSEQANNLATALKGQVKKQGNWGEMILESILEQSGLVKDRQYFLQATLKDPSGKQLRPDVLIKLPGSRTIIVDSKVSLLAYDRYVAADTKEAQKLALKEHLQSMYQHIDQLHGKNYDQIEEALDFTMLFVPIEPAYLLGIHEDPALWGYAYGKRILLISPTNLIACLKLMDDLWKREMQSRSALHIVKQGEKIYEKLIGFTQSLEAVGDHLGKAQTTYQKAMGQMMTGKGNLIDQAIKLKSMGLKSSKSFSKSLLEGLSDELESIDEDQAQNEPNNMEADNEQTTIPSQPSAISEEKTAAKATNRTAFTSIKNPMDPSQQAK